MNLIECNKCGWVHFEVTRAYAEDEVKKFNEYFNEQPKEVQDMFGGRPSSIKAYEGCNVCGNTYKNFKPAEKDINGSTVSPMIAKED